MIMSWDFLINEIGYVHEYPIQMDFGGSCFGALIIILVVFRFEQFNVVVFIFFLLLFRIKISYYTIIN